MATHLLLKLYILLLLYVRGNAAELVSTRIVGGVVTSIHNHPYLVSLEEKGRHFCGGTLVDSTFVLTAAHCVVDLSTMLPRDPGNMKVVTGKTDLNDINYNETGSQTRNVLFSFPHNNYTEKYSYDIALLMLEKPLEEDRTIKFVKLPSVKNHASEIQGPCVTTGWGATSARLEGPNLRVSKEVHAFDDHEARKLKEVTLPVFKTSDCFKALDIKRIDPGLLICTLSEIEEDACEGDSGGPLLCPTGPSGELVQEGITSYGKGCAQPGMPGVFTRVDYFTEWLNAMLDRKTGQLTAINSKNKTTDETMMSTIIPWPEDTTETNIVSQISSR